MHLGIAPDLDDDFYALGGTSLAAGAVANDLRKKGFDLSLADLLAAGSINGLLEVVSERQPSDGRAAASNDRLAVAVPFPLSPLQVHHVNKQRQGRATGLGFRSFNIPVVLEASEWDPIRADGAMAEVIDSHQGLRIRVSPDDATQAEVREAPFSFSRVDAADLAGMLEASNWERPFSFDETPRVRGYYAHFAEHVTILLVLDHLFADAVATDVVLRQFAAAYATPGLVRSQPPAIPFSAFVAAQRTYIDSADPDFAFWSSHLAGVDVEPKIVFGRAVEPIIGEDENATVSLEVHEGRRAIREACDAHACTEFILLLSALQIALTRPPVRAEGVLVPFGNRGEPFEEVVGWLAHLVVVRQIVDANDDLRRVIPTMKSHAADVFRHGQLPYPEVMKRVAPERAGRQRTWPCLNFNFIGAAPPAHAPFTFVPGVTARRRFRNAIDLVATYAQTASVRLVLSFSPSVLDPSLANRLLQDIETAITLLCAHPMSEVQVAQIYADP